MMLQAATAFPRPDRNFINARTSQWLRYKAATRKSYNPQYLHEEEIPLHDESPAH